MPNDTDTALDPEPSSSRVVVPSTVAAVGYASAISITATATVYATLTGNMSLPTTLGSALFIGVLTGIVSLAALDAYKRGWQ